VLDPSPRMGGAILTLVVLLAGGTLTYPGLQGRRIRRAHRR